MYNLKFFARMAVVKTKRNEFESFVDIYPNMNTTACYGSGPFYQLTLRETLVNEKPSLWGWKNFKIKEYEFIYPLEEAVRCCFPYDLGVEEKLGRGKLSTFIVEDFREI